LQSNIFTLILFSRYGVLLLNHTDLVWWQH